MRRVLTSIEVVAKSSGHFWTQKGESFGHEIIAEACGERRFPEEVF